MENKKKIIMVVLSVLVCIMAVGYAVLAQQLNITGTTSIDSTWKVEITNIGEKDIVGDATSKVTPSYTSTTANFNVGLTQPGDSITYDIEISNLGTLKAKVDSINVIMDENDAIKYTTSGVSNGDKLGIGEKTTLTIKVEYDSSVTSQPSVTTKDITVTINYVQDLDEGNTTATYQTYSIGDTVTFAGSNWYVIKNSSGEEDYVTLMKEQVLTHDELGENYAITRDGTECDTMAYYWSDTCHYGYTYGTDTYETSDTSGCEGHNDYEGSKVKEFLEGTYINTLGSDKIKEIDGYKVRLITTEELNANLGWTSLDKRATESDNSNVPTWVYQNFGDKSKNVYGYWTMTPHPDYSSNVWCMNYVGLVSDYYVKSDGQVYHHYVNYDYSGVRPVINLLKSSI